MEKKFFQCFWALGACMEVLLALFIMPTLGWKWLLGLSTAPLLAFAICCPVGFKVTHTDLNGANNKFLDIF